MICGAQRSLLFAVALLLTACATGPSALDRASKQAEEEAANCPGTTQTAFYTCKNEIDRRLVRPHFRYPDLLDVAMASRLAIGAKLDRREISSEDAQLALARISSQLVAENERRGLARRSVAAQEAASAPVSCTRIGDTVSCY